MHLDLRTLGHFVALIDHGSFAAAAAAVNLSQSAFSRSIQNLEQQAGHLLVDRSDKELPPTAQGRLVLDYARPLLHRIEGLKQELDQFGVAESGTLSFACGPTLATGLVAAALAGFTQRLPGAKVRYSVDSWAQLERRLSNRDIEFCVVETSRFEEDPRYRVIHLLPQRWYFYCRKGHPLATAPSIASQQLFNYPLATCPQLYDIRKVMARHIRQRDFVPTIECENALAVFAFVKLSDAIGVLTQDARASMTEQGAHVLTVRDLAAGPDERQAHYGIVTLRELPLSPLAQAFIEIIQTLDVQAAHNVLGLAGVGI